MIKIVGIIIILTVSCLTGMSFSRQIKNNLEVLKKILRMTEELAVMIEYNALTFTELIGHLKRQEQFSSFGFLGIDINSIDADEKIYSAISTEDLPLSDDQLFHLSEIFRTLGKTDIDGQISLLSAEKMFFFAEIERLSAESVAKCKMYNSLGVLGGAFIAVILI